MGGAGDPLAVGLAGAGPWAATVHAPMLAAGPETRLTGVWARRPEAAEALAAVHRAPAYARYEDLLGACEAVALAVPPDVQPALAVAAARAGKALLLEKPLGADLAGAEAVAGAVAEAGVASVVALTYRFRAPVRAFLDQAAGFAATGGRACFLSGAYLDSPFAASPWRQRAGAALLDVGPHVLDLVDAALGPVTGVRAHASPGGWFGLLVDHASGAASEVSVCCSIAVDSRTEVEVFGPAGRLFVDARSGHPDESLALLRAEFAAAARTGAPHACDAARGLHLQRLLDLALRSLADG